MNLHIMHYSSNENIHTSGMIKLIDSIDYQNNVVMFLDKKKCATIFVDDVRIEQSSFELRHNNIHDHFALAKKMMKYERIYLHSFSLDFLMVCIILLFYRNIFPKLYWIAYGVDLYEWDKTISKHFWGKIKKKCLFSFRKKIVNFVGIFKPDIDIYKARFNSKANTFYAPYIGTQYINEMTQIPFDKDSLQKKVLCGDKIRIQIGHQGNKLLHQKEIIEYLSRYKNENIEVFLPLNYGDKLYCDEVKKLAINIFGNKTVILDSFIPLREYYMMLAKVDIAVFYSERQIGLGNIYPLMLFGKKIYFKKPSPMYDYFSKQGINCLQFDMSQNISFDALIAPIDTESERTFASTLLSTDYIKESWLKVLNG